MGKVKGIKKVSKPTRADGSKGKTWKSGGKSTVVSRAVAGKKIAKKRKISSKKRRVTSKAKHSTAKKSEKPSGKRRVTKVTKNIGKTVKEVVGRAAEEASPEKILAEVAESAKSSTNKNDVYEIGSEAALGLVGGAAAVAIPSGVIAANVLRSESAEVENDENDGKEDEQQKDIADEKSEEDQPNEPGDQKEDVDVENVAEGQQTDTDKQASSESKQSSSSAESSAGSAEKKHETNPGQQ